MNCPECGSHDVCFGAYEATRDHYICNNCFYGWLAPKVDYWDAKARAIEAECEANARIGRIKRLRDWATSKRDKRRSRRDPFVLRD